MARNRRINQPGTYHHITARGVDRCSVFKDDDDRRQFLALLSEAQRRFGCKILAFCLMDNHIHLAIRDDQATLSKTLHFLNGVYAKRFNHKHDRTGHLFERRFWSSMLRSDDYLITCVAYVHRNPIEAGMVERAEDYRWSSYPCYLGQRSAPRFLDTSIVLAHYGGDLDSMRLSTERTPRDHALFSALRSTNPPAVLPPPSTAEGCAAVSTGKTASSLTPIDEVMAACASAFAVNVTDVQTGQRGRRNPARGMVALIAHRHVGHSLHDIAAALNLSSPASVSLAGQRFSESLEQHQDSLDDALAHLGLATSS